MNEKELLKARITISGFLKNRREELGITQTQLAEMTGMGIATIKRFESGKFWLIMKMDNPPIYQNGEWRIYKSSSNHYVHTFKNIVSCFVP